MVTIADQGDGLAVETHGTVHMRGETGAALPVEVFAEGTRLRVLSGLELIGEWDVASIGIQSLQDGFAIRAEGEELILKTDDDEPHIGCGEPDNR